MARKATQKTLLQSADGHQQESASFSIDAERHQRAATGQAARAKSSTAKAGAAGASVLALQYLASQAGRDTATGAALESGSYVAAATGTWFAGASWWQGRQSVKANALAGQAATAARWQSVLAANDVTMARTAPRFRVGPVPIIAGVAGLVTAGLLANRKDNTGNPFITPSAPPPPPSTIEKTFEGAVASSQAIVTGQALVAAKTAATPAAAAIAAGAAALVKSPLAARVAVVAGGVIATGANKAVAAAPAAVQTAAGNIAAAAKAAAPAAAVAGKGVAAVASVAGSALSKAGSLAVMALESKVGRIAGKAALPLMVAAAAVDAYKGYRREGLKGAAIGVGDGLTFGAVSAIRGRVSGPLPTSTSGPATSARAIEDLSMRRLEVMRKAADRVKQDMQAPPTAPPPPAAVPVSGADGKPAQVATTDGMTAGYDRTSPTGTPVHVKEYKTPGR